MFPLCLLFRAKTLPTAIISGANVPNSGIYLQSKGSTSFITIPSSCPFDLFHSYCQYP